jgi:hypothetical protein
MHEVTMVADTSLKYRGRHIAAGETFVATRKDAKVLEVLKRATAAPSTPAPAAAPTTPATSLDAADTTPAEDQVETGHDPSTYQTAELTPETPASQPKAPRTYKRKDASSE